eukprot:CAMPEP_0180178376 /NCGR_PEP_ID=MMETSP0986-20121125/38379_1 /TAXON_ID=697907 /ORGANISM="non described non described, Strain CCMP2293" /LENGTH=301 /DNA_ID=CAMNT_0022131233 /DNA_START=494 /DNA_END=1396 /DNA_ORIENTATION=-
MRRSRGSREATSVALAARVGDGRRLVALPRAQIGARKARRRAGLGLLPLCHLPQHLVRHLDAGGAEAERLLRQVRDRHLDEASRAALLLPSRGLFLGLDCRPLPPPLRNQLFEDIVALGLGNGNRGHQARRLLRLPPTLLVRVSAEDGRAHEVGRLLLLPGAATALVYRRRGSRRTVLRAKEPFLLLKAPSSCSGWHAPDGRVHEAASALRPPSESGAGDPMERRARVEDTSSIDPPLYSIFPADPLEEQLVPGLDVMEPMSPPSSSSADDDSSSRASSCSDHSPPCRCSPIRTRWDGALG